MNIFAKVKMFFTRSAFVTMFAALFAGCQSSSPEPLRAINRAIDLPRFMGDWYVIAHIPTFIEDEAYNGVESYRLAEDGTIPTTYTFNNGSYDGPVKTYHPRGFVYNLETKAEWRMQFVWPFKAAYLITYLDETYETTIIGVPDRSYVWIMSRNKTIPEKRYQELVALLAETGHDVGKLRKVPQR